jgi:hypothetical protein
MKPHRPGGSTLVSDDSPGDWTTATIDDTGAASFYPAAPTTYVGAVPELTDSAGRWDNIAGNTKANLVK